MNALLIVLIIAYASADVTQKKVPTAVAPKSANVTVSKNETTKNGLHIVKEKKVIKAAKKTNTTDAKSVTVIKTKLVEPTKMHKKMAKKYQKELAKKSEKVITRKFVRSCIDVPEGEKLNRIERRFHRLNKQANNVMNRFDDFKHAYDLL
mgnify:CR=1 FL=1